jgi:ATP-binding cassette subfamily B protein
MGAISIFITKQLREAGDILGVSWKLTKMTFGYYPWVTSGTILVSFFVAIIPFAQSGTSALLINGLIKAATTGTGFTYSLISVVVAYIIVGFIPDILYSLQAYFEKHNYIGLVEKFQLLILRKKAAIDIQAYEDPSFLDLVNKVNDNGVFSIVNLLTNQFANIQNVVQVIVAVVILVAVSPLLSVAIIIGVIPKFITQAKYGNNVWGMWNAETSVRRRYNDMSSHFERTGWLIELKLFQNVGYFFNRIQAILEAFSKKQLGAEKSKLLWSLGSTLFLGIIVGGATLWIISRVVHGDMQVGTMLFVLAAINSLQGALSGFFMSIAKQQEWALYAKNILQLIDTKPILYRSKTPITLDPLKTPVIVFEDVSFAYPNSNTKDGTSARTILKNISLTINAGEKFALVGENGAGKTTFVKLLCRIYDPTEGRILVDGHDLREIDLESWNRMLGVLFQEYATYHMPVKEAIAIGRSDLPLSIDQVIASAQASESESFIMQWKDTYDQMLGVEFEGGVDPSKGQNQRLAIARLLHRKAGVMILDEPTSSVDAEAEMKIFERIESSTGNQTVVLISHKFSTVRRANRICVFKDGRVEELGSHKELMANKGIYAALFKMQAEDYK